MESINNDIILRITPYLNSHDLLNLSLTCKRFGSAGSSAATSDCSLIDVAAKRILNAKEEQKNWFNPRYEGETWIGLVRELEKRKKVLSFDRLFGEENGFCTGDGDNDVMRVALREASEESGLDETHIRLLSEQIFDVDIHWVPDTEKAPAHGHIDIRFLVEADDSLSVPGSDESHEVRWIDLHEVSAYSRLRSTWRMLDKTRRLRGSQRHEQAFDEKAVFAARRAQGR